MDRQLHIVTHQVPYPADTDIAHDTLFAIRAFASAGIKVHLHCYACEREEQTTLNQVCHKINYYPRNRGQKGLGWAVPHMVSSRASSALVNRLNADDYPIVFMGLHSVYPLLQKGYHPTRKVLVRLNRLESTHHRELARITPWGIHKLYYAIESLRCAILEKKIIKSQNVIASSNELVEAIKKRYGKQRVLYIPEFRGMTPVYFEEGKGGFCLFHGNLAERENEYAAHWLLEHVFNTIEIPFVIAGNRPSTTLEQAAHLRMHTCLVADPSEKELMDLIKKAQVNLMPSFIGSSNKLGIMKALALGRHVLTNTKAVHHRNLSAVCEVAADPASFCKAISVLFEQEFTEDKQTSREAFLNSAFHDEESLREMIKMLY